MRQVVMTELNDKRYMKIYHMLNGGVSHMDIFILEDYEARQLSSGDLPVQEEGKLISGVHDRQATVEEVNLSNEILRKRTAFVLDTLAKQIHTVGKETLLGVVEVGGRWFAHTSHENLRFKRLAEVLLIKENLPLDIASVHPDFIPWVIQALPSESFPDKNSHETLQCGEGLFLRLKRHSNTIFATLVVMEVKDDVVERISAPAGFAMKYKNGRWTVLNEDPALKDRVLEEMHLAHSQVIDELQEIQHETDEEQIPQVLQ